MVITEIKLNSEEERLQNMARHYCQKQNYDRKSNDELSSIKQKLKDQIENHQRRAVEA
jgi:hypothetical protein